ncbi:helix-turn-helix domain-containing protein [Polynucleobacter sp. 30F-ANTBAC]|uniref:helix-turn-helix domain-containing protein n=1 Tax=Polynucleobacter sp. 30F-ANTBAC TaxID=2689095 RepID=UPI001C0B5BD7|nr:helix-turn-helix domain-containing protein [Polynucleobacter sp. 30F-ANTBAC]MBU3599678.1 helix-turn-helix domain-containing protein [Polynucleobacter sp. 30F-ANTBAC]
MLSFKTVPDVALSIAKRAQEARLSQNLSRKTLSKMSGVAESSIKRFEMSGEISIISLLKIAKALGHINQFEETFTQQGVISIEQVLAKKRSRGRS